MLIAIIILLLIIIFVLCFDFLDVALNWLGRIKIGTITDDGEWKQATQKVIDRWLNSRTPKVPTDEKKRLRLISVIKNIGKVESTAYWQDAAVLKADLQWVTETKVFSEFWICTLTLKQVSGK